MTHKILLADDSVTIRKVVELTFSDEDFTIVSLGDGAQALERARSERPDIVLSDVIMPGLNGYELCQQIKTDPSLRSIPFLFLKGTFESFDEQKARACGADGFIVKPFESQEMIAKVKELIAVGAAAGRTAIGEPPPAAGAPAPIPAQAVSAPAPPPSAVPPPLVPAAPRPAVIAQPVQPAPAGAPARIVPAPPAVRPVAPPPVPPTPVRPAAPAPLVPPAPPRPERAFSVAAPSAPPPPAPLEEFGFDFGEPEEGSRPAAAFEPGTAAPLSPEPTPEPSGETDEDLWSEVSLRDRVNDVLESPAAVPARDWPGGGAVDFDEETLADGEAAFEEFPAAAAPAETIVAQAPAPVPVAVSGAVDRAQIERLVAERLEAVVREVLEPLVDELARTMVETIAWEVIPDLAEAMIRTEIERIRQSARTD